ncbi:MAG: hypothetical protein QOG64_1974, partial [Acidimicrobiaceae bacterium]|nr:hypothetical protein [Acidimicrobiaceae bacterium]
SAGLTAWSSNPQSGQGEGMTER